MKKSTYCSNVLLQLFLLFFFSVPILSSAQTTYTFETCGAQGRFGPTQAQVNTTYTATTLDGQVTVTNQGIQEWTVPATGNYTIEAYGAQGGASGGLGAGVTGTFSLTAGEVLNIVAGQQGETVQSSSNSGAGGGGGSFVVLQATNTPLLVAAGGGGLSSPFGAGSTFNSAISDGQSGTTGASTSGTLGATGGNGGLAGQSDCCLPSNIGAGGGGGFFSDGQDGSSGPSGGKSFVNFVVGGEGISTTGSGIGTGHGGFGGGAGAVWDNAVRSGGGAGYNGGEGATYFNYIHGGGGGSYNDGASPVNVQGVNAGDGLVIITIANSMPTAICQDITVQLDASGMATIMGADVDGGSTDPDMDPLTFSVTPDTFDCSAVGTPQTVTLTVDDGNGGTDTCMATVTVADAISPTVSCNSGTQNISDDGTGDCTFTPFIQGQAGSYSIVDNCSDPLTVVEVFTGALNTTSTFSLPPGNDYTPVQAFPVGVTNVTVTVTDASGNSSSCSYTTTILDDEAPTAVCQDITVQLDATGNVTITGMDIDGGSSDACGIASFQFSEQLTAFAEVNEGQNLNINLPAGGVVTSVDFASYGNPNGSNGNYTLGTCHAVNSQSIVEGFALGNNSFSIPATNAVFGDPCFGTAKRLYVAVSYTLVNNSLTFTCADIGPNNVTLNVTDVNGNSSQCTATVTVEDNVPPVASCVAPFTLALDANGEASVTPEMIDNGSTDNCGNVILSFGFVQNGFTGDFAPANWSFNANGGTGSFSFDPSNENVTITGSDGGSNTNINTTLCNTVPFDGSIQFNWNYTTLDGPLFDPFGYSLNGTFIALTDPNGAQTQNGIANIVVGAGDQFCFVANTTDDILGSATTVSGMFVFDGTSQSAFTCADLGVNTVTLWVTDDSGNTSTCSTEVTIVDDLAPAISCTTNQTVDTDAGVCTYTNNGTAWDATATDNCTVTVAYELTGVTTGTGTTLDGVTFNLGETTVTWTATDTSSNTAVCSFIVTVEDNEAPVITCVPNSIRDTDPGVCEYTVQGTEFDATFTDNCTSATISNNYNGTATLAGDVLPLGDTTVIWTVDDGNGQTDTCTIVITVEDNEAPVITCVPNSIRDTDPGVCEYTVQGTEFDATFTDNCTSATISNDYNGTATIAGEVLPLGDTTIIWTVDDSNGQTDTCTIVITVEDNEAPVITCVPNSIRDTDPSVCSYTVQGTEFDATFTDNCTSATISNNYNGTATLAGEVLPLGDTTVIWTVDDGNGQTDTCTIIITVEDNEAPLMNCPADFTVGTDTGVCGATVSFADPIALDNCGVLSVVQTAGLPSGSVFPVGDSVVEYTATDVNGNTTICNFTITVVDDEAPMAICMDITIQLDAAGNASIVPADVNGGSTDNCAVDSLSIDIDTFTCADVGPNNVVLTVTDAAGNMSSCTAVVTVEDITPPIAVCQNITVFLDATGTVTIDPSLLDGGSTDACGTANFTYTATPDTFTCAEVGDNTVTLTVTDENGNSATCEATVTVVDDIDPVLVCQDITVELDENGMVSILPGDVIASLDDACGIDATGLDIDDFTCDDIGTPVLVNVFANDVNGNIVTCTATVTVVDALAPVVTCPEDQTVTVDNGAQYELPDYFADGLATATDNCTDPVTLFSQTPAAGSLLAPGVYTVSLSAEDAFGNVGTCEFELTVDELLGVNDSNFNLSSLTMYPNPATNFVLLSNPQNIPLKDVSIYDVTGRLIKTLDASQVTSEMRLDISELASANYMILINTENGQVTKQLVKE